MVISRTLQGISGTGIWTLGLTLITDSVPEQRLGTVMVSAAPCRRSSSSSSLNLHGTKQGQGMVGFSTGSLIGPPIGGVLYKRLGYRVSRSTCAETDPAELKRVQHFRRLLFSHCAYVRPTLTL